MANEPESKVILDPTKHDHLLCEDCLRKPRHRSGLKILCLQCSIAVGEENAREVLENARLREESRGMIE